MSPTAHKCWGLNNTIGSWYQTVQFSGPDFSPSEGAYLSFHSQMRAQRGSAGLFITGLVMDGQLTPISNAKSSHKQLPLFSKSLPQCEKPSKVFYFLHSHKKIDCKLLLSSLLPKPPIFFTHSLSWWLLRQLKNTKYNLYVLHGGIKFNSQLHILPQNRGNKMC